MEGSTLANGASNGTYYHPEEESKIVKGQTSILEDSGHERTRLLHLISRLRHHNVEEHFDISHIVMCGYQSTGKSSVLQAITMIPFPAGVSTTTKCITVVRISEGESHEDVIEITIEPSQDSGTHRNHEDRIQQLKEFRKRAARLEDIGELLLLAEKEIREDEERKTVVTKDIVHVRISSRHREPLQLYDLPGLIGRDTGNGDQETIRRLMTEYVGNPNAIIIAVVRANGDTTGAETGVLKDMCQRFDPNGERSLCVLTHPDKGEGRTEQWINEITGKESSRSLGFKGQWYVLRSDDGLSPEQESEFLESTPWKAVPPGKRGANALGERLRDLLFLKLIAQLPRMEASLKQQLKEVETRLTELGGARGDVEKVNLFRLKLDEIKQQSTAHSLGHWDWYINHHFSDDLDKLSVPVAPNTAVKPAKSMAFLRARIENEGEQFCDSIYKYGHAWESFISPLASSQFPDLTPVGAPRMITPTKWTARANKFDDMVAETGYALKWLQERQADPSSWYSDPARVADFFHFIPEGWESISKWHVEGMMMYCEDYCRLMAPDGFARKWDDEAGFENSETVAQRYMDRYVFPEFEKRRKNALEELSALNKDRKGRLISFDVSYKGRQRDYENQQDFTRHHRVTRALTGSGKQDTGETGFIMEPRTLAERGRRHDPEDHLSSWACRFVHSANCYYDVRHLAPEIENNLLTCFPSSLPEDDGSQLS